jgi:Flp pilus assembly pilin Flp
MGFVSVDRDRSRSSDKGASSVEYALLAGFIAAVAAAAFLGLGRMVLNLFEQGGTAFP